MRPPFFLSLLASCAIPGVLLAQSQPETVAGSTPARADDARILGISLDRVEASPRTAIPRHAKYRPRAEGARLAPPPGGWAPPASLLQVWPPDKERERPRTEAERLADLGDPREYVDAVRQAVAMADAQPSGGVAQAVSGWVPIGTGIYHVDAASGQHLHRAGRVACAAYAHDVQQGKTTLFVGGSSGGLWRYDWSIGWWFPISDTLPGSPSVGAFLVDPDDPRHILVGTGDPGRYTGDGLYRSTDAGATWTKRPLPIPGGMQPVGFSRICADRSDPRVFVASTSSGIVRSDDRGATWTVAWKGASTDLAQDPDDPDHWYSAQWNFGILESRDGGRTFQQVSSRIGPSPGQIAIGRISLTVCEAAPNYLYALVEGIESTGNSVLNNVWRSDDYGANWTAIETVDMIGWGQAFHTTAIAVNPRDPDVLMVGMGGFQFTENATAPSPTWVRRRSIAHADYTSFTFIPPNWAPSKTWVLATNDGGYYPYDYKKDDYSPDGNLRGLNLAQILSRPACLAQSPTVPDIMLCGTQDNGLVQLDLRRGTPHVARLSISNAGDGGPVSFSSDNQWECLGSAGGPPFGREWSGNAGVSYQRDIDGILPELASAATLRYHPFPGNTTIYTSGGDKYLYYKKTTGFPPIMHTWRRSNTLPMPAVINTFDLAPTPDVFVYAALVDGSIHTMSSSFGGPDNLASNDRTPEMPSNWNRLPGVVTADRFPGGERTAYFVTEFGRPSRAFMTRDRGASWIPCTGNLATALPSASFHELIALPANRNILFLTTSVGVFRSDNGGATWARFMSGMPAVVDVREIEIVPGSNPTILRIGTFGRGWFETCVET